MKTPSSKTEITVCMGSSCFSRGNSVTAGLVNRFIQEHNLADSVDVKGCLCESECKNGPNMRINGKLFSHITPEGLADILQHELGINE